MFDNILRLCLTRRISLSFENLSRTKFVLILIRIFAIIHIHTPFGIFKKSRVLSRPNFLFKGIFGFFLRTNDIFLVQEGFLSLL